jgi:hypothetical protein
MKKVAVAVVAVALIAGAPRMASAQGPQSSSVGAIFPTLLGVCTGGAIGYYFVTGPVATLIGAVAGGIVGNWWYTAGTSTATPGGKKMSYSETLPSPLELIGYDERHGAGLRPAAFSAASD